MYFLALGLVLLVMKYASLVPVATWSWWWVLSPFVMAVLWWFWADSFGYTRRKAMELENKRIKERRKRTKSALDANYQQKKR